MANYTNLKYFAAFSFLGVGQAFQPARPIHPESRLESLLHFKPKSI